MRIKGSGKDTSGFGGGWGRSDSFRKKHRLGQKVRGRVLKILSDKMAWVEIDGDRLLAQLAIAHAEGSRLTFIVKQLHPDIILKELTLGQSGGNEALALVSAFDTARILFENRFQTDLKDLQATAPRLDVDAFIQTLAKSPELAAAYMDAANCARAISTVLSANNRGKLIYQPWLAPTCRRQVTLVRSTSQETQMTATLVEFDHSRMGMVRIEFLHKGNTVACKQLMQHPKHSHALKQYLSTKRYDRSGILFNNLGISTLPQGSHGGIIAELLFKA